MKKILWLFPILILCICGCSNEESNNIITRNSMKIISENGEYAIALKYELANANAYSMYKNIEYNDYKEIWTFDIHDNNSIENRKITWYDDTVYLLYYGIVSYDVETGKEKYDLKTNMFPREGSDDISSLASTRLFGNDGKYIYYEYSFNDSSNIYYGKVSMDLSNVEVITKDEIPNELL